MTERTTDMRVLIAYGTNERQTASIAERIAGRLRDGAHEVVVTDLGTEAIDPDGFDGVVVGASIHAGRFQGEVARWVGKHVEVLNARPSWFFSVSLSEAGVLPGGGHEAAQAVIDAFLGSTEWSPWEAVSLAGAIRYRAYNWPMRRLVRLVVKRYGGEIDISRDHDYTDWAAVEKLAERVAEAMKGAGAAAR